MTAPRSKKMERRPHEPSANGERLLPQSPDAEQAVLSSILLNPGDCLRRCRQKGVSAAQFHIPAHATIYAVIEEMFWEAGFGQDDKPLNFISVTNELRNRGDLERAGGAAFVTELFTFIPTAANVDYYIEILQEKAALREASVLVEEFAGRFRTEQDNAVEVLEEFRARAAEVVVGTAGRHCLPPIRDARRPRTYTARPSHRRS